MKLQTGPHSRICHLIACLLIVSASFGQAQLKSGKALIFGKALNFSSHADQNTIRFIVPTLIDEPEKLLCTIRPDGTFAFETPVDFPQEMIVRYGNVATLVVKPNDTLQLEINANILNKPADKYPDGKYFIDIVGGTASNINKSVLAYNKERERTYSREEDEKALKETNPAHYAAYLEKRKQHDLDLVKKHLTHDKTGAMLGKWANDHINYSQTRDLLKYPVENPGIAIPADYFSFLTTHNMNDTGIISFPHADFLQAYYMRTRKDILQEYLHQNKEVSAPADTIKLIKAFITGFTQSTSGFTRDLFLSKYLLKLLNGNLVKQFKECYTNDLISNSYFRQKIEEKHTTVTLYLQNQTIKAGSNLLTIDSSMAAHVLDSMIARYRGKVVYVDFWAPWCTPCMEEMPHLKQLQEAYKGKEVVFLLLANRCSTESWKATIANKSLQGDHINLTKAQYDQLAQKFNITGIPHYLLIDKKGTIIAENAPRPGEKEKLGNEINKLLN